jgi:hypothetical protein
MLRPVSGSLTIVGGLAMAFAIHADHIGRTP